MRSTPKATSCDDPQSTRAFEMKAISRRRLVAVLTVWTL